MLLLAVGAWACGQFDKCKTNEDCNYAGNPCLICAPMGYCVESVPPQPPQVSPPGTATKWDKWLGANVATPSGMPLSYEVFPANYFDTVPDSQKSKDFTNDTFTPQCGDVYVSADAMNNYTFQTERLIAAAGTNLYDGAMWSIARCLTGHCADAVNWYANVLVPAHTIQLGNIRGGAECKGVMAWGECEDPEQTGACGLCYGDGADKTAAPDSAFFFRLVSDWYAFAGTQDARCPGRQQWVWNDWRPVLGENSWANLIGAVHVARFSAGSLAAVPDNDPVFGLAQAFLTTAQQMAIPGPVGGVFYAPHNVYAGDGSDPGSSASVENNVSLYAGLRALLALLAAKGQASPWYARLVGPTRALMASVEGFIRAAYSPADGYFRQGGHLDHTTQQWVWEQAAGVPSFAVDCQTWTGAVLGPKLLDEWFGANATRRMWEVTKRLSGYQPQADGTVRGVGFSNGTHDVFSGEWTLGAVAFLRVVANMSGAAWATEEANQMAAAVESDLAVTSPLGDAVLYANRRWFIPFGWWANSIPSAASTAWAALTDVGFNPFHPLGLYTADVTYG